MRFRSIIKKHKLKFSFILLLILSEAFLTLLFPLFIGEAIDGAIHDSSIEALQLGALGVFTLLVGVGRRVFDSRFYANVYQEIGVQAISQIDDSKPSVKSARLGMIGELVEFLENTFPELINTIIGFVGVILIIGTLNLNVFYGSLIVGVIIFLIYWITSNKTMYLNRLSNNELEKQVDVLSKNNDAHLKLHLSRMMKWNIKLSDLEATNFSFTWIILMLFLVGAIMITADSGFLQYGALFSLIMYVFQYIENVINLPFFYQNWLRLVEIRNRFVQPS